MDPILAFALGADNWTEEERTAWRQATMFRLLKQRRFHARMAYPGEFPLTGPNMVVVDCANGLQEYPLHAHAYSTLTPASVLKADDEALCNALKSQGVLR